MKKHLTFIILALSLAMAVLPGCKKDDDTNPLIGSWQSVEKIDENIGGKLVSSTETTTLTFKEDNTITIKSNYSASGEEYVEKGTYITEGNKLTTQFKEDGDSTTYEYLITGKILKLTGTYKDANGVEQTFTTLYNRV